MYQGANQFNQQWLYKFIFPSSTLSLLREPLLLVFLPLQRLGGSSQKPTAPSINYQPVKQPPIDHYCSTPATNYTRDIISSDSPWDTTRAFKYTKCAPFFLLPLRLLLSIVLHCPRAMITHSLQLHRFSSSSIRSSPYLHIFESRNSFPDLLYSSPPLRLLSSTCHGRLVAGATATTCCTFCATISISFSSFFASDIGFPPTGYQL